MPAVKDVPTYREMGFDVLSGSWVGFFAPAKTPDAVVLKLNAAINELMKAPDVQAKLSADRLRPDLQEPRRDRRLFQERGRQLGQDGARRRRHDGLASSVGL